MKKIITSIFILLLGCKLSQAVEIDREFFQKYRITENIGEYLIITEKNDPTHINYAYGTEMENFRSFQLPTERKVDILADFNMYISKTGTLYIGYVDTLYKYHGDSWVKTAFQFDHDAPYIDIIGFDSDDDPIIHLHDRYTFVTETGKLPITVASFIASLKPSGLEYFPDTHLGIEPKDSTFTKYPKLVYEDQVLYEASVHKPDSIILGYHDNLFENNLFFLEKDGTNRGIRTAFFDDERIKVTFPSIRKIILVGNKLFLNHRSSYVGVPTPDGENIEISVIEPMLSVLDLITLEEKVITEWNGFPSNSKKIFDQMFLINDEVYGTRDFQIYSIEESGVSPVTIDIQFAEKYYIYDNKEVPSQEVIEADLAKLQTGFAWGIYHVGEDVLVGSPNGLFKVNSQGLIKTTSVEDGSSVKTFGGYCNNGTLYFNQPTTSQVLISDITGRILKTVPTNVSSIGISDLPNGILIVREENSQNTVSSFKIINRK